MPFAVVKLVRDERDDFFESMIRIKYILFLMVPFLLLYSCEKVIDVDLNEADPAVVIEGNLSYLEGELEVNISKTGSYFGTQPSEKVENAEVFLETATGLRINIEEKGQGVYKRKRLQVFPGETYRLTATVGETQYTAVSTLYERVQIDSLGYKYYGKNRFFDGGYHILLYFSDPPDQKNYFRVRIFKNEKLLNETSDIVVFDDSGLEGKGIQVRLQGQTFKAGDTARVEMLAIDENAWEYFTTFREMANINPGSPAPANPVSNFSNGALGYFSAWSHDTKSIVIEP
ncbi:DUF4249 domain-containing protein [Mariniphaga sediminis]|uniref:DUF4249 domain-containing protein n=2 Tax=Mariniphaga sediminis TaxID=1628158 RepID=A0A399D0J4_9BACT|nr:DUF4249 domain-containing protein [Mariniphaga sediminis]